MLADSELLADLGDAGSSPSAASALRSFETTCSGVCRFRFIESPSFPDGTVLDPHSAWIRFGGRDRQDADVLLQCNAFDSSFAGAEYYRDDQVLQILRGTRRVEAEQSEGNLKVNLDVLQDIGLRLYDAAGSGAAAGQNSFRGSADQPNIWNIAFKGDSGYSSDARGQSWFRANGTLISDVAAVDSTNTAGKGVILVDPLLSSEQLCSQGATTRQSGGTTAPAPGGMGTATAAEAESAVPDRWAVESTGANPNTGPVGLVLAVPVPGPCEWSSSTWPAGEFVCCRTGSWAWASIT